jgi:hypothetical protein
MGGLNACHQYIGYVSWSDLLGSPMCGVFGCEAASTGGVLCIAGSPVQVAVTVLLRSVHGRMLHARIAAVTVVWCDQAVGICPITSAQRICT